MITVGSLGTHCRTVGMVLSDCQKLLSDYCRTVGLLSEFTVGLSVRATHGYHWYPQTGYVYQKMQVSSIRRLMYVKYPHTADVYRYFTFVGVHTQTQTSTVHKPQCEVSAVHAHVLMPSLDRSPCWYEHGAYHILDVTT